MSDTVSRRKFVLSGALLPAFAAAANIRPVETGYSVAVDIPESITASRELDLVALHTRESLRVPYVQNGKYNQHNLTRINYLLRDHRTHEVHDIDLRLLDNLYALSSKLQLSVPIHVISGFRSAATNAMLRRKSSGVARFSYHLTGRAIDIRIPGHSPAQIRDAAIGLNVGGVGYYPGLGFVHLDTGRPRHW